MSKFSKALEKIQKTRESTAKVYEKRHTSFSVPEELQVQESSAVHWDRGIPTMKNAKPDNRIVTYHYPTSALTEQYRMLGHNLKTHLARDGAKVILVSSAVHGEGKTVTATNLALTLAEMGHARVALVDGDLRRGRVGEYLGFRRDLPGLSSYLGNGLGVKEAMVRNTIDNLVIIPSGEVTNNPSALLGSQKFRVLMAELRTHFDYILVDSPPIMSVADAGILGRDTDGLLMVIQSGRTPKSVIAHASILFRQAGIKMLGYVLTNVEFQSLDYRYYYCAYDRDPEGAANRTWMDRLVQVKERLVGSLRKVGSNLEQTEQKFNQWWEARIMKKDERQKTEDQRPEPEG